MLLRQVFSPDRILVNLDSDDKDEVFEELTDAFVQSVSGFDRNQIVSLLHEREQKMSTGIHRGIAVPHIRLADVDCIKGVIGISRNGIDYDALDGQPVYILFMLVIPEKHVGLYLDILKKLTLLLKNQDFYRALLDQQSADDLYAYLCSFEDSGFLDFE